MKNIIGFFPELLRINIVASIVILVILAARLILKRSPKVFSYALWVIVLFRLLIPVSIPSQVSMIPDASVVSGAVVNSALPEIEFQTIRDMEQNYYESQKAHSEDSVRVYISHSMEPMDYLPIVWLAGIVCMTFFSGLSYWKIRKKIRIAVPLRDNIRIADDIKSPFVIGFFRPKIYLPNHLGSREQEYIILHEQHHIRRFDHIIKAMAFLALTVHWFNPLVWVAFGLACKDMEMSCDEAVIQKLGSEVRADYSASLLTLATGRRIITGTPLSFGEGDTKGRIKNLSKWKKPAVWVMIVSALLCVVLAVSLLTDPTIQNETDSGITCYLGTVLDITGDSVTLLCDYGEERQFTLSDGCTLPAVRIQGEHVMVYTTTSSSTGVTIVTRIEFIESELRSSLEEAIMSAILAHHAGKYYPAECQTANFEKLSEVAKDDQIICYGIVLYQEYSLTDGVLEGAAGALVPTVLTFHASESDGLYLTEYWEPRDGSYYAEDIKSKFRGQPWPDTTKYLAKQELGCYLQAANYFDVDTDTIIHSILVDIETSSRWVEGFSDLMISCKHEREVLSAMGTDTIRYCFVRFQEGGYDDLYGQIMAYVCSEILDARGVKTVNNWSFQRSGQDWFEAFIQQNPEWQNLIPLETEN